MAISASFSADFSSFKAAVDAAQLQLKTFESGAGSVDSAINRIGNQFSGVKVIQQATLMAAAIDQLGGTSTLTAAELDKISTVAQAATAKLTALGQDVPAGIQAIADATDRATGSWSKFVQNFDIQDAISNPIATAKEAVGAFAETLGPGAVAAVGLGTALVAIGGGAAAAGLELVSLANAADATGEAIGTSALTFNITDEAASRLKFAIEAAGGSFDLVGTSMFTFQQRLENSSAAVDKGLTQIGLSATQLKGLSVDQQFLAISDALRGAGDNVNKAAVAFDIFGRQGREQLPLLLKPLSDLNDASDALGATWSTTDVEAAQAFTLAQTTLAAETTAAWTSIGKTAAGITNDLVLAWDRAKLAVLQYLAAALSAGGGGGGGVNKTGWAIDPSAQAASAAYAASMAAAAASTSAVVAPTQTLKEQLSAIAADMPQLDLLTSAKTIDLLKPGAVAGDIADLKTWWTAAGQAEDEAKRFAAAVQTAVDKLQGLGDAQQKAQIAALMQVLSVNGPLDPTAYAAAQKAVEALINANVQLPPSLQSWWNANQPVLASMDLLSGKLHGLQPAVQNVTSSLDANGESLTQWAHDIPTDPFHGISISGDQVTIDLTTKVIPAIDGTAKHVTDADTSFKGYITSLSDMSIVLGSAGRGFTDLGRAIGGAVGTDFEAFGRMATTAEQFVRALKDVALAADDTAAAVATISAAAGAIGLVIEAISLLASAGGDWTSESNAQIQLAANADALAASERGATEQLTALQAALADATTNFNAMALATDGSASSLQALGDLADVTFAQEIAAGKSVTQALADMQPGLQVIENGYAALGLTIQDAGLQALLMQSDIATANPTLAAGIASLASEFKDLKTIGDLNVGTLEDLEATGTAMYTRLQAQVSALGGTTKDALIPMQDYLHQAQDAAVALGVPLDAITQSLIDQSQALGIWQAEGQTAADLMTTAIQQLNSTLEDLILNLQAAANGWTLVGGAAGHPGSSGPPGATSGTSTPGAATGGLVTASGIKYFTMGGNVLGGPWGTDTVPAWLSPGEMVLTDSQQKAVGTLIAKAGATSAPSNADVVRELRLTRAANAAQTATLVNSQRMAALIAAA